jgi:hypothetical protein
MTYSDFMTHLCCLTYVINSNKENEVKVKLKFPTHNVCVTKGDFFVETFGD